MKQREGGNKHQQQLWMHRRLRFEQRQWSGDWQSSWPQLKKVSRQNFREAPNNCPKHWKGVPKTKTPQCSALHSPTEMAGIQPRVMAVEQLHQMQRNCDSLLQSGEKILEDLLLATADLNWEDPRQSTEKLRKALGLVDKRMAMVPEADQWLQPALLLDLQRMLVVQVSLAGCLSLLAVVLD